MNYSIIRHTIGGNNMTRSAAREQAFMLLFEKLFNPDVDCGKIYELAAECEVIEENDFTHELFIKADENTPAIDGIIKANLRQWKIERISKVSLAVLRLAVCEIEYFDDIPVGATINEAVELCKKYAGEDEYIFVNGVLGSYSRSRQK